MRRILVPVVGALAIALSAAWPAQAATPTSVIGSGSTTALVCDIQANTCSHSKRSVMIATLNNTGILRIAGLTNASTVNCVRSATVHGVTGLLARASDPTGHYTLFALNEGGNGIKPWALASVYNTPFDNPGDCGSSVTAAYIAQLNLPPYAVPASQFRVIGG